MFLKNGKIDHNIKILILIFLLITITYLLCLLSNIFIPLFYNIFDKLLPIILGIFIAFLLNPLVDRISIKFFNKNKKTASVLTILLLSLIIIFIIYPLLLTIITNFNCFTIYGENLINKLMNTSYINQSIKDTIMNEFSLLSKSIFSNMWKLINNFLNFSIQSFLTAIITIFTLLEYDKIIEKFLNLFSDNRKEKIRKYIEGLEQELFNYIKSMFISFVLLWFIFNISLYILNIENFLSLGFIISLLIILIPIIGPLFSTLILAVILFYNPTIINIIGFIFLTIFIQIFINIISPKIFAESLNLSNLLIIITFFIGNAFFGLIGALFSLPILIFIKYTLNFYYSYKIGIKKIN